MPWFSAAMEEEARLWAGRPANLRMRSPKRGGLSPTVPAVRRLGFDVDPRPSHACRGKCAAGYLRPAEPVISSLGLLHRLLGIDFGFRLK